MWRFFLWQQAFVLIALGKTIIKSAAAYSNNQPSWRWKTSTSTSTSTSAATTTATARNNGQHVFARPSRHRLFLSNPSKQTEGQTTILLTDHAPSWKSLEEQISATPTGARLQQEAMDREKGLGPPHTDAVLRLFPRETSDNKRMISPDQNSMNQLDLATRDSNVRVTLYRDQSAWCPYCQKVWLFLELKGIPYRVQKLPMNAYGDKPDWYTRMVDGGKLPALELDGTLHVESMDIIKLLEQTFDHDPEMIPSDDNNDHGKIEMMANFLQLEQELQSAWFSLTFYPVEGEALPRSSQTFLETLARVDDALNATDGPWFLGGDAPSVVDIHFITQVERIIPSVLFWKGLDIRGISSDRFPNLKKWLSTFETLPAYLATRSDYYTHCTVIPSQNGPGYMIPQAKPFANKISGLLGSWNFPLNLDDCLEPFPELKNSRFDDYSPCHEAAYKLIQNHEEIVPFACRGAGEPGRPAFHAELADPYAEPNEDYTQAVDVALRHVANALLGNDANVNDDTTSTLAPVAIVQDAAKKDLAGTAGNDMLRENWEAYPDNDDPSLTYYWNYETGHVTWTPPTQQLDTCLTYLRDRIGVPRDMGPAAAMQLRAHLNWAIELMRVENT